MSSRSFAQTGPYDSYTGNPLPPPPPRDALQTSPLRRQNVLLPPVISTALPAGQGTSNYSTPVSGVSRQSPFSAVASSPLVATANTPIVPSPMASRVSHFNVQYDPRDWAPGTDARAAQIQRARENAGEDGLASPPPPYSPEAVPSPNAIAERVQMIPPTQSPPVTGAFSQRRGLPVSNTPPANRHSIHMGSYRPPPPPVASPPMPRQRVVSDMQNGYDQGSTSREPNVLPPSARRAASASAEMSRVPEVGSSSRSVSRQRTWMPGMPLPGPPPGPPPSSSRSQSTSGAVERQGLQMRPRALRQTIHVNDLGPIPPTPSTWTEGQPLPENNQNSLHVDTAHVSNVIYASPVSAQIRNESMYHNIAGPSRSVAEASTSVNNMPGSLSRSSALRDSSAKGLRERRAQSRNSRVLENDLNALSVQTNPWANALSPDGSSPKQEPPPLSGPRSGRLAPRVPSPLVAVTSHERNADSALHPSNSPPVSPNPTPKQQKNFSSSRTAGLTPRALPTPPLTLQTPKSMHGASANGRQLVASSPQDNQDAFQLRAIQRHSEFLEKERLAQTDTERLQLFADFVLHEASLRQKKYESAFESGDFDVEQFRSNIFKPAVEGRSASNSISQASIEEREPTTNTTTPQTRPETMWWKDYQPALSPIASMDYDEMSSRGRAPSRWWESQTGSQSGANGGRTVHRSKRESKYMGLSKEFLMANSPSDEYPGAFSSMNPITDSLSYPNEKANPETFGFFDAATTPRRISDGKTKKPATPALMDISRFITLPPPYPRHYPAVNNCHPDLTEYRTTVRTLSELDEVPSRKLKHKSTMETTRGEHQRKLSDSRRNFKVNVQAQIAEGSITYAEAAEAEQAFRTSEFEVEKRRLQSEFDALQDQVINPLHDMLHSRLSQLDSSIQKLLNDLYSDARHQDPDQPQEEGDEKPELLEKLTQLKWLFDVREQIHKECFDLMSERNNKFKAIVMLPHHFFKNTDKIQETGSFFEKDAHDRFVAYCKESLARHESFLQTVDQHVRRGVELQSSAFWDIAPGLLDLLQKIPEDLRHFQGILIPDKEYNENPSYHQHPQQYLYSLLSHAEKSTYQFIEGQVNLQCLLHEVKTSLLGSKYRSLEAIEGRDLSDSKLPEEAALTAELKQKASMIEEQWLEALGSQLQATRERVKMLLQEEDAWDDIASEDA